MKYSVKDIDEMRRLLFLMVGGPESCQYEGGYDRSLRIAEDQLRTYMSNGTTIKELQEAVHARYKEPV